MTAISKPIDYLMSQLRATADLESEAYTTLTELQGQVSIAEATYIQNKNRFDILNGILSRHLRYGTDIFEQIEQFEQNWKMTGSKFLVGEEGPELFTPGTRGTVIPGGDV